MSRALDPENPGNRRILTIERRPPPVIPAKAGIHLVTLVTPEQMANERWIPAFAGMTGKSGNVSRRDFVAGSMAIAALGTLQSPPRLIVRGDDMGYAHAGNEAIVRCFTAGIESSIEVLAPSPWFPEAVRLLAEHPTIDVGVHLALTSEWDTVKWRPLTDAPSLRDANGYFLPKIYPDAHYPGLALTERPWQLADVERELRAQIVLAKQHIPRLSHWSSHMGCAEMRDDVKALVKSLGREHGIDIVPAELGVTSVSYVGAHVTSAEKRAGFVRMLESLEAGRTYLFVDHPGLDGPELRAIHHVGYENVAADRQGVTDTWTDPHVRATIRSRNIQLIGYRDLVRR